MQDIGLKPIIEIIAAATIALAPLAMLIDRYVGERGMGARAIQFTTVAMLLPTILILALEKILEGATVGTLIGGLIGYILSGIGDFKPDKKGKQPDSDTTPTD